MKEEYKKKLDEELKAAGYGPGGYWADRLEQIKEYKKKEQTDPQDAA